MNFGQRCYNICSTALQIEVMELLMKAKQTEINLILSVTRHDREVYNKAELSEEKARRILSGSGIEDVSER